MIYVLWAFWKIWSCSLVTYMRIYKKGDTVDIKGMGTVQKGMPPGSVQPRLTWDRLQCHPARHGHHCKQVS
ncbi:rCG60458 [Rattus norvegicus]|uniref:60S ribosomal protein L21 n=1 Tax=Rattus norvegicus TaxID=10116 RepID=A6KKD6_RAT|nr:rCG60458 [Rattus norvegicus]